MLIHQFTSRGPIWIVALLVTVLWHGPYGDTCAAQEPAEDAGASASEATAAGDAASPESFADLYDEFQDLGQQLRDLQKRYKAASESELDGIREEYHRDMEQGKSLLARLRASAIAAYKESPNTDEKVNRWLIRALGDDVIRDDYESAMDLARVLIDGKCEEPELPDLAGRAAFALNDFDMAATYLKQAEGAGTLSKSGQGELKEVEECKRLWSEEQAIREKEAAANDLPRVKLTTTQGDIVLELFENEAPQTVGNFVSLVENGFYDGLTFHRVLPGFMAQGGCPKGDGTGGPGYNIYCECQRDDHRNHFRGSLSMAKSAARNTGGSQFFLTFVPTPHLNGEHTVFGRVIEGMDVLAKLRRRDPSGQQAPKNVEPDKIIKAEVVRKRDHDYVPTKVVK